MWKNLSILGAKWGENGRFSMSMLNVNRLWTFLNYVHGLWILFYEFLLVRFRLIRAHFVLKLWTSSVSPSNWSKPTEICRQFVNIAFDGEILHVLKLWTCCYTAPAVELEKSRRTHAPKWGTRYQINSSMNSLKLVEKIILLMVVIWKPWPFSWDTRNQMRSSPRNWFFPIRKVS